MKKNLAFSLVEMLVAMAVFSAVAILMGTILSNVAGSGKRDENRVAASTAFRTASDRMMVDWNAAVLSESHRPEFQKLPGNDSVYFFSHVRSPKAAGLQPRLARVGYRVLPGEALVRDIEPVDWDAVMTGAMPPAGTVPFEELCGAGIFRIEMAFQDRQGNLRAAPPASVHELKAVVVAFAALDPELMLRMTEVEREALADLLPDVADAEMPGQNWAAGLLSGSPAYVQGGVRFYQRWFLFQ